MTSALRPMHPHEHRFWFFPDSRLGRWAIGIFLAGVVLGLTFPLTTPLLEHLTGASHKDTLFVTPVPYAVILAGFLASWPSLRSSGITPSCFSSPRCWARWPVCSCWGRPCPAVDW